jgi:hypothetical protein
MPILTRSPDGPYYSEGDERAFFDWLKRISCVQRVRGSGAELQIHVRGAKVSSNCLRELIALCWRYQVPMGQLAQFESAANRKWFKNPATFWYRAVFVGGKPSNKPLQTTSRPVRVGKSRRRVGATRG